MYGENNCKRGYATFDLERFETVGKDPYTK